MLQTIDSKPLSNSLSIDRIDSTKGYTYDNVVLCRSVCNLIKNDLPMDEFKMIIAELHIFMNDAICEKKSG